MARSAVPYPFTPGDSDPKPTPASQGAAAM